MEYILVSSGAVVRSAVVTLPEEVMKKIKEGWEPLGGPVHWGRDLIQAMIRK